MLLLATVVNYMDRQTIGSVSSFIKRDFALKEEGYGTLEAWFGYSYAVFLIVSGVLADRLSLRWLYAGALLVWSGAGFATGLVATLGGLQLCRAVLGAGEAFNWPVAVGVVRRLFPPESRAFANSVFNSGVSFGAVATPLLVLGMVDAEGHGWRVLFQVVGLAGFVVVALWLWFTRGARAEEMSRQTERAPETPTMPFVQVFTLRTFWITLAMGFSANMAWIFYRVWLPRHLTVDLKFTDRQLQLLLIAFYLTADAGSIAIGFLSRRLVRGGQSVARSRKTVALVSGLVCLVATPLLLQPGRAVLVPLYCLVGAGIMGAFAMFYSFVQDIAPGHTSKSLGVIGASVWFVTSRLHPVIGRFADTHAPAIGKFAPLLLVAGTLPMLAALFSLTWPEKQDNRPA
jgi:ACS family hexuronate transporter-like MFS transporter